MIITHKEMLTDEPFGWNDDDDGWFEPELYAYKFEIEENGVFIASLYLDVEMREDSWRIMEVFTRPEYRRQGHAERLIKAAVEFGRDAAPVWIKGFSLHASNESAKSIYERCGFNTVSPENEMYLKR